MRTAAPGGKATKATREEELSPFVKFIGTHAEYDRIDALPYRSTRGNGAWKSDQSAPTKIIKPRLPKLRPAGVHPRAPRQAIGLTCFSHLSRSTNRSDGLLI